MTVAMEVAQLLAASPAAMHSMPADETARGPKRSDKRPPPMPSANYSSPDKPNTSDTSARVA